MHVWNLDTRRQKNFCLNFQHLKNTSRGLVTCTLVVEILKDSLWKSLTYFEKLCCSEIFDSWVALAASFRVETIPQMIFLQNHSRKWLNRHNIKMLADGGQLALSKILAAPFHLIVISFYWWKWPKDWWIWQNR